jgi:hypothetical protein
MKFSLLLHKLFGVVFFSFLFIAHSFEQENPGGNLLVPLVSTGSYFVHTSTAENINSNYTTIDNPSANDNPNAKLFITHYWNPNGGGGNYNDHNLGLWYRTSTGRWTIFTEDVVSFTVNVAMNVLVADGTNSTVFQHSADVSNIISNFTLITHPELDGNPNARILASQILLSSTGSVYNNREIGVWYNGAKWGIFNQNMDAMPVGASFNVVILNDKNSLLHTATTSTIEGIWTKLDHPAINNNPKALIYVTQNFNPGGGSGIFNPGKAVVWYNASDGKWGVFNEDISSMVPNCHYNVFFGSPDFAHKSTTENIQGNLTTFENPLINRDANARIFVLHNWNPFGTGTQVYEKKLGVFYNGMRWGIFSQDASNISENVYFNVAVAPHSDSAFLHTTEASNISANYTKIDHPLLNNNPDARIIVQPIYISSYYDKNIGVWYDGSKWTIYNHDFTAMLANKHFNVWYVNSNKSFIHQSSATNINGADSYLDDPLTNNNPDANILITEKLSGGGYHNKVQGVFYDVSAQKWSLYNEDLSAYTAGQNYIVYVANAPGTITSVENENPLVVNSFNLEQNYPNPFNPATKIRFALAEQSQVTLKVYNILGKEIATLVNGVKGVGVHEVSFDGSGLASGVYFYTLQTEQFNQTRKMLLMK